MVKSEGKVGWELLRACRARSLEEIDVSEMRAVANLLDFDGCTCLQPFHGSASLRTRILVGFLP